MSPPPGLDPGRAAEVITTRAGSAEQPGNAEGAGATGGAANPGSAATPRTGRRGSGYLVADGLVLTAAHVLLDAESTRVRFNADQPGEWTARAEPAWSDAELDVALLRIDPASVTPPGAAPAVTPVRFGRITRPPVDCEALGFPLFKMRENPVLPGRPQLNPQRRRYRDSEHAVGVATSWSNLREGTMAVKVDPPDRDPDPGRSPWAGMSGAAVFSGDFLIGVIGRHHRGDGLGTLAAYRIDHWHRHVSAERLAELSALLQLPLAAEDMTPIALRGQPRTEGPYPQEVVAAATESYLKWVVEVNGRLPVTGLAGSRGALDVALDRVYVGLKVDSSSPTERASARENLWRELNAALATRDLGAEEETHYRWVLISDLPVADYFGVPAWLERHQAGGPEVLNIGQLYRRDDSTVILGDPGSGKTTIMRWLALLHAQALRDGAAEVEVPGTFIDVAAENGDRPFVLGPPLLPILVRIAEYAADRQQRQSPRTLLEFLGHHTWNQRRPVWLADVAGHREGTTIPAEILAHLFGAALREHRALVVLDGLDEVPAKERTATADAVGEFVNLWVRDAKRGPVANKVIVTSRIAGYQLAPLPADLTHVTIEGMTDPALRVFLRNWLAEVLAGLGRQRGEAPDPAATERAVADLLELLGRPENRYVRDLATNPLLAGVIVSVFLNKGNALPSQRVEVYQSAVDTLVAVWSQRLSGTYDQAGNLDLFDALPAVAAHVHDTRPNGVIRAADFRDLLVAEVARLKGTDPKYPGQIRAAVDSLLQIMAVELGLLVESGPEAFRFAHQSFQEFLAAQHLVGDPAQSATRILERLGDPRWREPILMAIGIVNWKHPGAMTGLAEDLLAQKGPLAQLFPETALLLAAAIPQMTDVPARVVRRTARHLLDSYSLLSRGQRLPRVRELLEAALSTLRTDEHTAEVDSVLVSALNQPPGGDPAVPCATARLIRSLDAASPQLAVALAEAAVVWDRDELGSPITETLGLMVSPAKIDEDGPPEPRLPPTWGTGLLGMRETLRADPVLTARVCGDPDWLSLIVTLYGGYWNLAAADGLDEYERMSAYLQLDDSPRSAFEVYFAQRWGRDNPVYNMAVYLDTEGKEITRRASAAPLFTPDAITRDSPFTWQITQALRDDDLPALVRFLHGRRDCDVTAHRAEALLALWALGAADEGVADSSAAGELAARRIAAMIPGLRDVAVRAAGRTIPVLADAAAELPPQQWDFLAAAVTRILHYAGARPVSLFPYLHAMPEGYRARVLIEEMAQRLSGWGDDTLFGALSFTQIASHDRFPGHLMLTALNSQGTSWSSGYRRYTHSWPSDPLAFPYGGGDDIPLSVLDQVLHLPAEMDFILDWEIAEVFPHALAHNPQLLPEVLAVAWACAPGRATARREATIASLDAELGRSARPVDHLLGLATALTDPWHRARALLRIAELFPAHRPSALREAVGAVVQVFDPVRAFQLRERLGLLVPPQEKSRHRSDCRALATIIPDPATAALALLRVAATAPAAEVDELIQAAVDRTAQVDGRAGQLELLRLIRELFTDTALSRTATDELLNQLDASAQESAHVSGRWGAVIGDRLAARCLGSPGMIQSQTPISLYARATDLVRAGRQDQLTLAWRELGADPTPARVQAVIDAQGAPVIRATGAVIRTLHRALAATGAETLEPLLGRLVQLGGDGEPTVRSWLAHDAPRVRQTAALLLTEYAGPSAETLTPITELLLADDDLQQARARACIAPSWNRIRGTVSRIGAAYVEQLARFCVEQRWTAPGIALVFTRFSEALVHDDPQALAAWCEAAGQDGAAQPAAAAILRGLDWATDPAWALLMDRLRDGEPVVQSHILTACSRMHYRVNRTDATPAVLVDPPPDTGDRLRLDAARWPHFATVLRALDPEPLRTRRLLTVRVEDVIAAADDALAATDGVLTADSSVLASKRLWERAGTSFGEVLAAGGEARTRAQAEAHIQDALFRIGESHIALRDNLSRAAQALLSHGAQPRRAGWPWTALLTQWATGLLARSPQDEPGCWERTHVMEALSAAAETNPDTFRRHADVDTLSRLLTEAALHHNGFPGREAAARLLGVLRHGSPPVLDALQRLLHDTEPSVRESALDTIPALRSIDRNLTDDLVQALSGPSVITAWAAAQLLGAIGENVTTPKPVRDTIIATLAQAIQAPESRRTVHFSFVEATIPDMPELDDVFTEALRRVYRLG